MTLTQMPKHPAKYTDSILQVIQPLIPMGSSVVDVFGGTGKLRQICPTAVIVEIEPDWAPPDAFIGDATHLPADWTQKFDVVCTSPCYGNRMADTYTDHTRRITYTSYLGHSLHPNNAGAMQWGDEYRDLHLKAWLEVHRILKPNGLFILNISDHIRKGRVIRVSAWHMRTIKQTGFTLLNQFKTETPRMRFGENQNLRVDYEFVYLFQKNAKPPKNLRDYYGK